MSAPRPQVEGSGTYQVNEVGRKEKNDDNAQAGESFAAQVESFKGLGVGIDPMFQPIHKKDFR